MPNHFGGLYAFQNIIPQINVLEETRLQNFTHAMPSYGVTPNALTGTIQIDLPGFYIVTAFLTITVNKNKTLLRVVLTRNNEPTSFQSVNQFSIQAPDVLMVIAPIEFRRGDTCSLRVSSDKEVDMVLVTGQLVIQHQGIRKDLIFR